MVGQERFKEINSLLNKRLEEKKVLIAVHRGCGAGNIVENTIPAYRAALQMNADMFECDVIESTDGVLYAIHDTYEMRLLNQEKNIKTFSSKEIDSFEYLNRIGEPSNYHVEKFEAVLQHFNHGELFNIDRAWDIMPSVIKMLEKYPDSLKQALIKTKVKEPFLEFLENCPTKVMYMPIVKSMEEIKTVLSYKNINTVGVEILAQTPEDELFRDENIQWIKEQGLFCWANAITLSGEERHILYAGLDDDISIKESPEKGWGKMMEKGIDIIQTDWPGILSAYRDRR